MIIFLTLAPIFFFTLSFVNKCDALTCQQCKEHHHEDYEGYLKNVHDGLSELGITKHDVFCPENNQNPGEEKACNKDQKFCLLGHVFIASKVGYFYKNLQILPVFLSSLKSFQKVRLL